MGLWNASRKNKQFEKGLLTHQQDFDNVYGQHWWLVNCQAKIRINILLSLFLIQDVFNYSFAQGYSSGDFTSVKQTGLQVFLNKALWSNHLTPPAHRYQAIQSLLLPVQEKRKLKMSGYICTRVLWPPCPEDTLQPKGLCHEFITAPVLAQVLPFRK